MSLLSGVKLGAGIIIGIIGAVILLAILVALVAPEKPTSHAETLSAEQNQVTTSNAPSSYAETVEGQDNEVPQSSRAECGASDGICPDGCTGLIDEDCILSSDKKWVLEDGVGVWIENARFEECVNSVTNEKKYYIVVKVGAENKGTEYQNWIIGDMDTSIIINGKTVEPEPGAPSFVFMMSSCEAKYKNAKESSISKLAPGTSAEAYIVFDVTEYGDQRGKDILFVWDPNPFEQRDEVVWKVRVS